MQHLQQRLHAASSDRTAELEHVQQLNRSLKAEIAAMQNNLAGMSGTFARPDSQNQPEEINSHGGPLESFGSCLLVDPGSSLGQSLPQLGGSDVNDINLLQPYRVAHRLAPIPEGDGNVSTHTSMPGDEGMQDVHLVPELQSQVRLLAVSLQDKTQEAEALHQIVEQFKSEVTSYYAAWLVSCFCRLGACSVGVVYVKQVSTEHMLEDVLPPHEEVSLHECSLPAYT